MRWSRKLSQETRELKLDRCKQSIWRKYWLPVSKLCFMYFLIEAPRFPTKVVHIIFFFLNSRCSRTQHLLGGGLPTPHGEDRSISQSFWSALLSRAIHNLRGGRHQTLQKDCFRFAAPSASSPAFPSWWPLQFETASKSQPADAISKNGV